MIKLLLVLKVLEQHNKVESSPKTKFLKRVAAGTAQGADQLVIPAGLSQPDTRRQPLQS